MADVFANLFVMIAYAAVVAAGVALALVVIFLRSNLLLPHARAVYCGQALDLKSLNAIGAPNHQFRTPNREQSWHGQSPFANRTFTA